MSSSPDRTLSVLVVVDKTTDTVDSCLASAAEHLPGHRVLVWDNSGSDTPGWHRGSRDIGYAAAVNALAAMVPDDDILLLSPDFVLLGSLTKTFEALRSPGVAASAPLVLLDESTGARRSWDVAHRTGGVVRALVAQAGYAEKLRRTPLSGLYAEQPRVVDGHLGNDCLAISRDAWNEVGSFDEEFFRFGEVVEWQTRARAAGWRVELADEPGATRADAGDSADDQRSRDLLRANVALNLEHSFGVHRADSYLAGTSLLERVRPSGRRARGARRHGDRPSVVITTNRLVYGGAERQHVFLATELTRRGYDVTIVCVQRFGPLIADVDPAVRVVRQPWWAPVVDVGNGRSVVITGDTNTETGFGTLWRRSRSRRRWLVAAHIPPEVEGPTYSGPLAAAMRRADGFIALSQRHWAEATAHQDLGDRWFTAPNGVASENDLRPRAARSDSGTVPQLVMLSRIVEHKNPHLLVEALDRLRDLPWELSIFGDGPDRERLEALTPADLSNRVHWRGWSPGPDEALVNCDLLCVPSRSEAFPLVILEAMARSIPVIASSVCAVPEMLDHGKAGLLVDDITVDGWQSGLANALGQRDSWREIGVRGFERMRAEYTIEAMADSYEQAISAVFDD